ncbi:hypothetical protein MAM1_0808c11262 [Mucor ambiguus]|uniref:Uncharacterized protein n=1 Tax=Mucor ambiguus TaxID=91626 RepID=A0A0C9MLK0_9FUNG|nr:hypothetical protein MAM1_0808c11262 [Mucor ambiguus]
MNVDLDKRYADEKHGAYAVRIHRIVHRLMSPEPIPNPNNAIHDTDIRRYNAPTADEIDVLIVGGEDESNI